MTAPVAAPAPAAPAAQPAAPAAKAPNAVAPAAEAEPLFEVKVNGEVRKYKRSEAEKLLSKAGFADKTIQQAREALKAAAELKAKMAEQESVWDDEDKLEAELAKRGKLDLLARKRLEQKLREQELTPEQRRIAELEAAAADKDKKLKAVDEEKEQQAIGARAQHIQKRIESMLGDAWQRAGFETGDSDAFMAVYDVMREWKEIGLLPKADDFSPMFAEQVVDAARQKMEGAFKGLEAAVLKGLKGEALAKRLGDSVVNEILRFKVEQLRGGGIKKPGSPAPAAPATPETFISPQEAMKRMRGGG